MKKEILFHKKKVVIVDDEKACDKTVNILVPYQEID